MLESLSSPAKGARSNGSDWALMSDNSSEERFFSWARNDESGMFTECSESMVRSGLAAKGLKSAIFSSLRVKPFRLLRLRAFIFFLFFSLRHHSCFIYRIFRVS